jgi:hypothetical protein
MGRVYCGPYAEQVGYEHEGYAARVLPNGQLTASWSAETDTFVAHVAACACGWTGGDRHPATDAGEDAAVEAWERDHLQPLVAAAAREGWRIWGSRAGNAVAEVAAYVAAGRLELAVPVMKRLVAEVMTWARVLDEHVEEAARGRGER